MIIAPHSGSGKTTLSLGLSRAFTNSGFDVQPFKVGPDYIDSSILSKAAKKDCYNLDAILMKENDLLKYFQKGVINSDITIVEGVMGALDSFDVINFSGSSIDIARKLNIPLLITINNAPSLTYYTLIIKGLISLLKNYDTKIGVIINKTKSNNFDDRIAQSIKYHTGAELLGVLPDNKDIAIPSRHLGLFTADEIQEDILEKLSYFIKEHINITQLAEYFRYNDTKYKDFTNNTQKSKERVCHIALDRAFSFYYRNNLEILEEKGFELRYFSPLNDDEIHDTDFIYLGGGYPELFAEKLSENRNTMESLKKHVSKGTPIFAECGGFIYLGKSININGKIHQLSGIFDLHFEMKEHLQMLGYVSSTFERDNIFFSKDKQYLGHQFRYSKIEKGSEDFVASVERLGKDVAFSDGCLKNNCFGSYTHFNFSTSDILEKICEVR